jgi:predicted O-methyltransferase YrrM
VFFAVTRRSLLPASIEEYVLALAPEDAIAARLREETARLPQAGMQIGADQAALLALLVKTSGARRALEIGTFTGYSALAVARALPADGTLLCCDVSAEWTAIARRYWSEAGVSDRITLKLAPALETLAALHETRAARIDFAFIDADKANYDAYYEACLALARPGALIALDNPLWSGRVAEPGSGDADTEALKALNAKLSDDPRVDACLLTIGDGMTLARVR